MYLPKHFEQKDTRALVELIKGAPLGTLVVNGPEGFEANHIPFVYRDSETGLGVLCAHVPRANPVCDLVRTDTACLAIFNGPQGYVTPSWYATKHLHGKVVPTWNYSVVHVHGRVRLIDDAGWVSAQLHELTNQQEGDRANPWSVFDAPEEYVQKQLAFLVGLELTIDRIVGKTKASQNQPEQNRRSIIDAIATEQPGTEFAHLMNDVLKDK